MAGCHVSGSFGFKFYDGATLECFYNCLHMEGACASDALPLQVDIVTTNFPPHAQEELKSKIITLNPNVLPQLLRLKR